MAATPLSGAGQAAAALVAWALLFASAFDLCAVVVRAQWQETRECSNALQLSNAVVDMDRECCDEPDEDCSSGYPASCNEGCANVLLPIRAACREYLSGGFPGLSKIKAIIDVAADRCAVFNCDSYPCQNGATCMANQYAGETTEYAGEYQCECSAGYEGSNCDAEVDYCASRPCENGGSCMSTEEGYQCECKRGYEGSNCATFDDPCDSGPCQNGGACSTASAEFQLLLEAEMEAGDGIGYQCECARGWDGRSCDQKAG
eukprot:SAG31_NODE_4399_length_3269_cov_11.372871_4_plen_260_part_00